MAKNNNMNWWLIIGVVIVVAVVVSLIILNGKKDSDLKGELASLSGPAILNDSSINLINFFVPSQVRLGQSFQIGCDFGERLPCIAPTHTGGICSWVGWDGSSTVALFNCTANSAGVKNNTCNLFNYPADSRCVRKVIPINSTNVIASTQTNQTG